MIAFFKSGRWLVTLRKRKAGRGIFVSRRDLKWEGLSRCQQCGFFSRSPLQLVEKQQTSFDVAVVLS